MGGIGVGLVSWNTPWSQVARQPLRHPCSDGYKPKCVLCPPCRPPHFVLPQHCPLPERLSRRGAVPWTSSCFASPVRCAVLSFVHRTRCPFPVDASGLSVSSLVHTQPAEFSVGESACGGQSLKGAVARQGRVHPPAHLLLWAGCVGPASCSLSHPCCPRQASVHPALSAPAGCPASPAAGSSVVWLQCGLGPEGSHPLAQLPRPHHPLSQAVKSPGSCGLLWGLGSVPSPHLAASLGQDLQGGALWKP